MKDIISSLVQYFDEVVGRAARIRPSPEVSGRLPIYMGQIYDVYEADIFDRSYRLLVSKKRKQPTPAEVAGHNEAARKAIGADVVFVFPKLKSFERRRLLQHRVPFIVPKQQMYLPGVLVDLRESSPNRLRGSGDPRDTLSAAAQALLLFYLQRSDVGDWPLKQWSETLRYSAMTISRACKELAAADLCDPEERGRKVLLRLDPNHRALWEKAQPWFRSPVKRSFHVRLLRPEAVQLFDAGLTALSRLTMIAEDPQPVQAISDNGYRAALEERQIEEQPLAEQGLVTLQRWRYAPSLLSPDGRMVDHLSLYLSLRDDPDERIQGCLKELLEGVGW